MGVNLPNFLNQPIQDSPLKGIIDNIFSGYQSGLTMRTEPAKLQEEQKQRLLANQLSQLELEHKPKEYSLNDQQKSLANALQDLALKHKPKEYDLADALKQSQIDKNNRPGSTSGAKFNGMVANYVASHPHATEDEIRDFADKALSAQLKHQEVGTERGEVLNATQYNRGLTQISKKHDELRSIDEGKFPGTDQKISPEKQNLMRNDLLLSLTKDVTDPATRAKLQNATNMNITLDSINPDALTVYSGGPGKIDKMADSYLESVGAGSEKYQNYIKEVTKASAAAKQMRQYLGDSIQPTAQERLDHLTNPEAWNVSPKVAKENFEFIRDLYKRETQTLVRAATDPTLYQAQQIGNNAPPQQPSTSQFNWNKYPVAGK